MSYSLAAFPVMTVNWLQPQAPVTDTFFLYLTQGHYQPSSDSLPLTNYLNSLVEIGYDQTILSNLTSLQINTQYMQKLLSNGLS